MDKKLVAEQLRKEASALMQAADILEGADKPTNPAYPRGVEVRRTGARKMSEETRRKLSESQKARWASVKKTPAKKK